MAEKEVALLLTLNGSKAIKTVGELKKGIADTRKELEKTEIGTKKFDELSEAIKQAEGRISELNAKSTFLRDMPGPIGMVAKGFHDVKTGVMTAAKAMFTLSGAIAATGIGLLLVAFAALQAYFTETERGAKQLRVIMAALGAIVGSVKDVVIALGESLVKFARGDFSGSVNTLKSAFNGLGNEIRNDVNAAIALERALNSLKVSNRELEVDTANLRAEIKSLNKDAEDVNLSFEKRADAARAAGKIEEELLARRLANAEEEVRIIKAKNKLNETSEEALQELADAEIKRANLKAESLELQTTIQNKLNAIEAQIEADRIARATAEQERLRAIKGAKDKAALEELERQKKIAEEAEAIAELEFKIADLKAKKEVEVYKALQDAKILLMEEGEAREIKLAELMLERKLEGIMGASEEERELRASLEEISANEIQEIRDKYAKVAADNKKKADDKALADEKALAAAKISVAQSLGNALGSISSMIEGESKAAITTRKILAVAQIAIDTATAIAGAISQAQSVPFPGNIAAIATGIASVIAGIASAYQALKKSDGVAGGSTPSAPTAPSVPSAPSVNPVTTNTTELGNTQQANLAPIQAYVVETELTGTQNNVSQIESQATFGGG